MHVVDVIRSVVHIILLVIHLCVSDSVQQKKGDPFHAQFVAPQFANDERDPCKDAPHSQPHGQSMTGRMDREHKIQSIYVCRVRLMTEE